MRWVFPVAVDQPVDVIGGKAHGLAVLRGLGLPVPPAVVVGTPACREFLRTGRLPEGLVRELTEAVAGLGRVSVRSGAAVSMPGMMSTVLDVDPAGLVPAVEAVFASWNSPRARTYRELHGLSHDVGTAVAVQSMVYGERGGSGVVFSRDPNTGAREPFGEVAFGRRGVDVVSGGGRPSPLGELAAREPRVWRSLLAAAAVVERHYRDVCHLEFTYDSGDLWLLQVRHGGLVGRAAVRAAVDLAEEGTITRAEALLRVRPADLASARTPRLAEAEILTRGVGACPGVARGRLATTADRAVRLAAEDPVILARPETSPLDLHGLAAAAGVVTARGGPTSHAAVVARSMGKPAVVGVADLTVTEDGVVVGGRRLREGVELTIDGAGGEVALGSPEIRVPAADRQLGLLLTWAAGVVGGVALDEASRLAAAQALLRR